MSTFSDPSAARIAKAIGRDDDARVRELVAAGANLYATGDSGVGLLGWALIRSRKRPFVTLLDAGAAIEHFDDHGDSVLHYAAIVADHWFLKILLTRHADANLVNPRTGRTPLMDAVSHRRNEQVRLLLAAGADPDVVDQGGEAPLHVAAEMDDYGSVLDLLYAGADPEVRNGQGATFQRYLAMTSSGLLAQPERRCRAELVGWLRDHGIAVDAGLLAQ
ncbi:ankyrin repeat domain-containing protein [Nocardia brasiliensis]|uniref:ankyrin repeat domain-containing protein n=1 Tax=Nocardia brasiliensis TaxID=37326 RepID=UPI002457F60B|nr:ankyrin repeat domain-containing protein [Nocardia brasiliensis]